MYGLFMMFQIFIILNTNSCTLFKNTQSAFGFSNHILQSLDIRKHTLVFYSVYKIIIGFLVYSEAIIIYRRFLALRLGFLGNALRFFEDTLVFTFRHLCLDMGAHILVIAILLVEFRQFLV